MARVITLDFTSTCARVSRSVGFHYAKAASFHGLKLSEKELTDNFKEQFQAHSKCYPNFGAYNDSMNCRDWWHKVVSNTFWSCGVNDTGLLRTLSSTLYDQFLSSSCWELFDDVMEFVETAKKEDIKLGIISNFDDRLGSILSALELDQYFDFVICSYIEKCHKPNSQIFEFALSKAGIQSPSNAWHIGNDLTNDYHGAKKFGMNSFLLSRSDPSTNFLEVDTVQSLTEAMQRILVHPS